jgi:hypothetical protein
MDDYQGGTGLYRLNFVPLVPLDGGALHIQATLMTFTDRSSYP